MRLDHVNLRTARLEEMVDFYRSTLGLEPGKRPPFPFPGAWLYAEEEDGRRQAVVHLIGIEGEASDGRQQPDLRLEHYALRARDLKAFLARLKAAGVEGELVRVPGGGPIQVNLLDPDGNHLHVDFPPEDAEGLDI